MNRIADARPSNDGDQFHYAWAARRCLRLLDTRSKLVAVSIEGVSQEEPNELRALSCGNEVIDVTEYFGSESLSAATRISYVQLKHSTHRTEKPITLSDLEKTLVGFSQRYRTLVLALGREHVLARCEFVLMSNRPFSATLQETLSTLRRGGMPGDSDTHHRLAGYTTLEEGSLRDFCNVLRLEGGAESFLVQNQSLRSETQLYLSAHDADAPIRLKELVTAKATSLGSSDPVVRKTDVLRALGMSEDSLFPARSKLEVPEYAISRYQEGSIAEEIIRAERSVLVHASGGVGKSVFALRLSALMPAESRVIVYDCFGNGEYRRTSRSRHRHEDGLVQIANELAAQGLCNLMLPSVQADSTQYLRAFLSRVEQSAQELRKISPSALVVIVIDAADNAEIMARESGFGHSFPYDLIREQPSEGVRFVFLSRSERLELLEPSSDVKQIEIRPFSLEETAAFVHKHFADASESDIEEFHSLTSNNPRVQVLALDRAINFTDALRWLGPNPLSVQGAIEQLLNKALEQLQLYSGVDAKKSICAFCAGLATLRPLIPIEVLAALGQTSAAAVRSFGSDMGRSVLILGDSMQFRDEPTETWFRENFQATPQQLEEFLAALTPLSTVNAYAASSLPALLLNAGRLDELIDLALSSEGLPAGNSIEKRDIETQRLQFALKACLRAKRYVESAKLALKVGEEASGEVRQQKLLWRNTDLLPIHLSPTGIQEFVARSQPPGEWLGVDHVYRAAALSFVDEFKGESRGQLRMANEWLSKRTSLSKDQLQKESIEVVEVAEMAIAELNLNGSQSCAHSLGRWRPRSVSFHAGRIVARRFVDHAMYADLDEICKQAGDDHYLLLAATLELKAVNRIPAKPVVARLLRILQRPKVKLKIGSDFHNDAAIDAIVAFVEAVLFHRMASYECLAWILDRYLPRKPTPGLISQYSTNRRPLLRAYALRAALHGRNLEVLDLAHPELRKELNSGRHTYYSQEAESFRTEIGALLPWYQLSADCIFGTPDVGELRTRISRAREASSGFLTRIYHGATHVAGEIAAIWFDVISRQSDVEVAPFYLSLEDWIAKLPEGLYIPEWIRFARIAARTPNLNSRAHSYARKAFELERSLREDAESKAGAYVEIARTLLPLDGREAKAYVEIAIGVTGKLGDEVFDRWDALLELAERAADERNPSSETAYRLARCGEVAYEYLDRNFDWERSAAAIFGMSFTGGLAVSSRWRDRGVERNVSMLPVALQRSIDTGGVDPLVGCALISFYGSWNYASLIDSLLHAQIDPAMKAVAVEHVLSYMRVEKHSPKIWGQLEDTFTVHGITDDRIGREKFFAQLREDAEYATYSAHSSSKEDRLSEEASRDLSQCFAGLVLHTPHGIAEAYTRFRREDPPWYDEIFWGNLVERIEAGHEAELIESVSQVGEFNLFALRSFFECIPGVWKTRLSVSNAIEAAIKAVFARFSRQVRKGHWRELFPFELASRCSGIPEIDLVTIVLEATGRNEEILSSGAAYTLVGLLADKLNQMEAHDALQHGLELFESNLEESDGDGPWSVELNPPANASEALAKYLWVALGSPVADIRWQAAHVVRGLCKLNQQVVVERIIASWDDAAGGAFVDQRLHFYQWHARTWLVIALARAADESPQVVKEYRSFLVQLMKQPHVMIAHFSAQALDRLVRSGHVALDAEASNSLSRVNTPGVSVEYSRGYQRSRSRVSRHHARRFMFGLDWGRYWLDGLAELFALSSEEVEVRAEKVILDDWGFADQFSGAWKDDARHQRGVFRRDETHHSHGSFPSSDDLNFYLSYHAMLVVAGKLLATLPVQQGLNQPEDAFAEWFRSYLLTRQDGLWLADRRDPEPFEWPEWKNEKQDDSWRWSVRKADFERVLRTDNGRLNLSGQWKSRLNYSEESVHVSSALVSLNHSDALLRALQTASSSNDYYLPNAGDEAEIDVAGFRLGGWVADGPSSPLLDKFDRWSGSIKFPPLMPANFVIESLHLDSDSEARVWRIKGEGGRKEVLWSQLWGTYDSDDDWTDRGSGRRLQASQEFIVQLLSELNLEMVVEVEIRRQKSSDSHRGDWEGSLYAHPYYRIFIIGKDGRLRSL